MTVSTSLLVAIADDEASTRDVLRAMLTALGHQVTGLAEDGQKLVEQCQAHRPDLAIIDLEMPVLDGLATAEELKATAPMPVILLSGHPDFNHVVRDEEPIEVYLSKPVTLATLDKAIRQAMTSFQRQNGHG
jgi:two-component system, response regulator PdtaR